MMPCKEPYVQELDEYDTEEECSIGKAEGQDLDE